ncbi:DUF169 domain-containing protein [Anaerospora hongkongensis]|uniref:DUF169 domain-containing protein n=1 Tax=Anaerospora hongkongensis TaxID=244830 RepID=UPI00289EB672|nr:DUF169 domain-containing protein [Anaerospora hongkongensis]
MPKQDAAWLDILLDLRRKPAGIRFLLTEADYAASKAPELTGGMPYCTAVKWAGAGRSCKMDAAHGACFAASRALGMAEVGEEALSGSRHAKLGVYENLAVSRSVAKDMVYCAHQCHGVEIMPLEAYDETNKPDVVVLVTTPHNAMRLTQGYAYHNGQLKDIKMAGMCAICQECTSYPFEKNRPNISMLCSGTRCVAQWAKDELGVGIPYHQLGQVISGLQKTVNPMEANEDKQRIARRLAEAGRSEALEIVFSHNYYTGAYGTPEQLARRKK